MFANEDAELLSSDKESHLPPCDADLSAWVKSHLIFLRV